MPKILGLLFSCILATSGCASTAKPNVKDNQISVVGGTTSPALGIGFDATYDPNLDGIIPGYKILLGALTNKSLRTIQLDPVRDRWEVTDRNGRDHPMILNLRDKDPDTWAKLPTRLQQLIEYPLLLNSGSDLTIDLLVDDDVDLSEFKFVTYVSEGLGATIQIVPRYGI